MDKPGDKKRLNWKLWLGLLTSAVAIYLALRKVDFPSLWGVISGASLRYLLIAAISYLIQFVIRAWRWRILLNPLKSTGFSNRFIATLIGFAANNLLPARLGEFIRADILGQREEISRTSTFATIVVERLADGFTLLLILMTGILLISFPREMDSISTGLKSAGLTLFIAYILIIAFFILYRLNPDRYLNLLNRCLFFLPVHARSRISEIVRKFGHGLAPVRGMYGWVMLIFYSLLLWALSLFQIRLIEASIGISLPFIATFIILAMASFGVMIPSSPGYIGTFHLAVQYGFMFFGLSSEEALSAAILYHASFFFPTILFGVIAYIVINAGKKSPPAPC